MDLSSLKPPQGARKKRKRVGRGHGSGHGKTSCRGHKGQNSRSGGGTPPGFEGGQMPLQRRLPKRGFTPHNRVEYEVVNLKRIAEKFSSGDEINAETLKAKRLVRKRDARIKILADGELGFPVTVTVDAISAKAREMIEKAGGTVNLVG